MGESVKMDGNTFIGGITSHREQFWCEKCGHIQWASYTCSDIHEYKDHIKCEICGSKKMLSKSDIESNLSFIHIMNGEGKNTREIIGREARWKNILQEMKLRERD